MSLDFNKVILAGRVCSDLTQRTTSAGTVVVNFCLAVNRRTPEGERSLFIDIAIFGDQAETLLRCKVGKGTGLLVDGWLEMDEWNDRATGAKRTKIKCVAAFWRFTESKASTGSSGEAVGGARERSNPEADRPSADDTPF